MDFRHSILIYHLTEAYTEVALKSISDLTAISEKSISLMKPDRWGVKLLLDNEHNFRKVLSLCVLNIHGKAFSLYPLVTDLIILGSGGHIDALKVQLLLERYAPVLVVCEVTNPQGASAFRGALNYPEIPEITRLWTGSQLKISGYDGIEFSISSFCRFCRLGGHFKSQCKNIKDPFARDDTLGFPSLPDCKFPEKRKSAVSSCSSNTELANFAKGSLYISNRFPIFDKKSSDSKKGFEKFTKRSNLGFTKQESHTSFGKNTELASFTKASFGNSKVFAKFEKGSLNSKTESESFSKESSDSKKGVEKFSKGNNTGLTKHESHKNFGNNTELENFTKTNFGNKNGFEKIANGSSDSKIEYKNFTKENSDIQIEFERLPSGSNPRLTKQQSETNFDSNTGLANCTKASFDSSNGFAKSSKGSSDSSTVCRNDSDTNKKSTFETSSLKALSPYTNLKHLIPPSMQTDIEALKLFFSHCKNFKHLYKSALRYPSGVGTLIRQLRQIVKFSKNIKTKSEEEIKFIAWVCLLLSKLQYYYLKKNIQLEPFYVPPL